jgi:hypothetical protein
MDRYVRGEDVAYDDLRRAWQDTTSPTGNDSPQSPRTRHLRTTALPAKRDLDELRYDRLAGYVTRRAARIAIAGLPPAEAAAVEKACADSRKIVRLLE